jgi:hypothetical protein
MGTAVISAMTGPLRSSFASASHVGWWIIAGCGAVVLAVGLLTSGRWARQTAERTAAQLAPETARIPAAAP